MSSLFVADGGALVPTDLARGADAVATRGRGSRLGNGVSRLLPWETHLFINPELTVHLLRPAEGAWICLDARNLIGEAGIGMAESSLYDERGRIGGAAQSLLVDARPPPAG